MNYKTTSFIVGFTIWILATIAFKLVGHHFFLTNNLAVLIALYIAVVPILGFVALQVFNRYKLTQLEAIQSATIMVLPGMVFDTFCIKFFAWCFPNLPETDGATFGSWLMWAYAVVLIFGLMRKN